LLKATIADVIDFRSQLIFAQLYIVNSYIKYWE